MSITLYLEANFITAKEHNPFFAKMLATKGELLYIGKQFSQATENYFKDKLNTNQQLIQTPEEALAEYLERKGVTNSTIFIDDALGALKKETLTKLLNSDAHSVFVIARFEDWLHGEQNKYTLSNGFDSFLISRPVITNPQRLLEFVNVFPESEEKVLDWTEHPRKLPVNSYYVFNKKSVKKLDAFAIFDAKKVAFISLEQSKQSLPREDKGLIYFNALSQQMKVMMEQLNSQSTFSEQLKAFIDIGAETNKEEFCSEINQKLDLVSKKMMESESKVGQIMAEVQLILEALKIKEKEAQDVEENVSKVTLESIFVPKDVED
ncbi:hypothetical protein [Lactococcus lactis]|uniref:DUF4935 domain-containing protein n=1 Tax=Lactococcus lactis TaxID=1358 RepID=A0AAW8UK91_9LACT|nr:hypothetical protein [Lactococcus lactis]MDT2882090.1 hypothetical protein [Lactococcus lactis]MDT2946751.1 hypothetical protein [Lactococcus lactis]MDT2947571.1 hypothetical protein [Lactococcus lactis]